jgi:hypothetical protein
LSIDIFREYLAYDPDTGVFTWLKRTPGLRSVNTGDVAGAVEKNGYRRICVLGKRVLAHRLAYAFVHGEFPAGDTDHINGDRDDNRACNLRAATRRQNQQNQKVHRAGHVLGTTPHKGRWRAQTTVAGVKKHIGIFDTQHEAHQAYIATGGVT